MHQTASANPNNPSEPSPTSWSAAGRPPPLDLSPEQVEAALEAGAAKAAVQAHRTAPTPARKAFDAVLEQAGGNLPAARAIVAEANRDAWRARQRDAAPFGFESSEEAAERRERQLEADRQRLLSAAGIPAKYAGASIQSFHCLPVDCREQYAETARSLMLAVREPGAVIGLVGIRGPGKTYMGCAAVRAFCLALRPARYVVAADYLAAIMGEYKPGGNVEAVERRFRDPELLVIDEIQVRPDTVHQANRLTSLVDYRYRENRTTVLIGNLDEAGFRACVGDSIADRVYDGGGILTCNWSSLRGRLNSAEAV